MLEKILSIILLIGGGILTFILGRNFNRSRVSGDNDRFDRLRESIADSEKSNNRAKENTEQLDRNNKDAQERAEYIEQYNKQAKSNISRARKILEHAKKRSMD